MLEHPSHLALPRFRKVVMYSKCILSSILQAGGWYVSV